MQIRTAQLNEVPALTELIARSVRAFGAGYYTPRQIELSLIHVFGVDTQLIADQTYYVIDDEGSYAG